jgi:predicted amidophosphoribosyltransferase
VAISNSRLEHVDDQRVIFRYRDNRTQAIRRATLSGVDFLQRFLQHVLPRRFTTVWYFGLWSRARRRDFDQARYLLGAASDIFFPTTSPSASDPVPAAPPCPLCHAGTLTVITVLP